MKRLPPHVLCGSVYHNREMRDLARKLIAYWTHENRTGQDLLRRIAPITLLHFLQSKEAPPADELEKKK